MLALTRSFVVADLISHIAKVCLLRDKVVSFQVCFVECEGSAGLLA